MTAQGSVDLGFLAKAEPWQLRLAAAMLLPYFPMQAAILNVRANNLAAAGRPDWADVLRQRPAAQGLS
jgi:hypothetical protein